MPQEVLNIIYSVISIIATGIASLIVAKVSQWLNAKIKDKKLAEAMTQILSIAENCVKEVFQTFVDSLKKEGKFDKEKQQEAFDKCKEKIKSQLSLELLQFIQDNFGDVENYIGSLIESTIYSLKA